MEDKVGTLLYLLLVRWQNSCLYFVLYFHFLFNPYEKLNSPLIATDIGCTLNPKIECKFFSSQYPDIAIQPAKKVMCHTNMKHTANPLYVQKIRTDWNGLKMPIQNETISVTEVIVIDTAASDIIRPMRSGTLSFIEVRRHAANITNVSSIPIPEWMNMNLKISNFCVVHPSRLYVCGCDINKINFI